MSWFSSFELKSQNADPWNAWPPRLVVTTTPARPPYSALYELERTCISWIASRPGAEFPTVPKIALVDAWPSCTYETP